MVVDRLRPTHGAYRIVSAVLASGLTCLYFALLRVVYVLFRVKFPDVMLYVVLVGIVALAWYGLKSWQFGHLRAAQALVSHSYRQSHFKFRGWLAAILGVTSILVVLLVAIITIESYTYWP